MTKQENERLNEKKWNSEANTYDSRYFTFYIRSMQEKIVSLLNLNKNQRLLDIGCGTGRALRLASNLVDGQGEFYGIDISSKMLEVAKSNSSDKNIHFYKANAEKLPFEDDFFDLIMCCNSFHHYSNPNMVLSEMCRVLNQNGRVYILDPTTDMLFMKIIDIIWGNIEPSHVKQYSTKEYEVFFEKAGLKYIQSISVTVGGFAKVHVGQKGSKFVPSPEQN